MPTELLSANEEERDHLGDLSVGGRIILKYILSRVTVNF